ncbi:MAG: hypothetical protein K5871_04160 [Lachnospiraceae bacterium]|nr:hypothetical protein [Lachnospiraceae bacterium]
MIDWEDIVQSDNEDELKKLKLFLFQENLRIDAEKQKIASEKEELKKLQDSFMKDRVSLRDELNELNRKTTAERQRLKQENLFFEKKMEILKDGFRSLEEDRRKFEREKEEFESSRRLGMTEIVTPDLTKLSESDLDSIASVLFAGITSPGALKKRYKDLIKIFHPDNLCGDERLSRAINKEYHRLKQ